MVKADGAVGLFLLGEVEDEFGLVVVAELGVGGDAVAVAGVLVGLFFLSVVDVLKCLGGLAQSDEVHAQVQEGFVVVGLLGEDFAVGVGGFFVAGHGVEGEPEAEEPVALVGVDGECSAEQA